MAYQRTAASKAREEIEDTVGYGASCDNMAPKCNLHGFSKASTGAKGPSSPRLFSESVPNSLKLWNSVEHAIQEDQDVDHMGISAPSRGGK